MKTLIPILLILVLFSCAEEPKKEQPVKTTKLGKKPVSFVDPTKSMDNEELKRYDSIFNVNYSFKLNKWKTFYEDSLNCEIVFHTARDGYALCINFINFKDEAFYDSNLDEVVYSIDEEMENIEAPMRFIHTRRIKSWPAKMKYELRFSGADYEHYEFAPPE